MSNYNRSKYEKFNRLSRKTRIRISRSV
ncbi:ribbon-helix-helix domain-containing protein [Spiroplasma endosymbiont of Polydrusus formosus]